MGEFEATKRLFDVFVLDIMRVIPSEAIEPSRVDLDERNKARGGKMFAQNLFGVKVTFSRNRFGAYTPRKRLDCRLRDTLDGALLRRSV